MNEYNHAFYLTKEPKEKKYTFSFAEIMHELTKLNSKSTPTQYTSFFRKYITYIPLVYMEVILGKAYFFLNEQQYQTILEIMWKIVYENK